MSHSHRALSLPRFLSTERRSFNIVTLALYMRKPVPTVGLSKLVYLTHYIPTHINTPLLLSRVMLLSYGSICWTCGQ